jgi:hypothetical protein
MSEPVFWEGIDLVVKNGRVELLYGEFVDSGERFEINRNAPLSEEDAEVLSLLDDALFEYYASRLMPVRDGSYIATLQFCGNEIRASVWDADSYDGKLSKADASDGEQPTFSDFPAIWRLVGFLFSKYTRERVYQWACYDLLADYAKARRFKGRPQRTWLALCFGVRTAKVMAECVASDWAIWILIALALLLPAGVLQGVLNIFGIR